MNRITMIYVAYLINPADGQYHVMKSSAHGRSNTDDVLLLVAYVLYIALKSGTRGGGGATWSDVCVKNERKSIFSFHWMK